MSAPELHFEPFLHLVDVGEEETLIAWGGFCFRRGDSSYGEWRIVDDEDLRQVAAARTGTIGASFEPYGVALVEVERDGANSSVSLSRVRSLGVLAPSRPRFRLLSDVCVGRPRRGDDILRCAGERVRRRRFPETP